MCVIVNVLMFSGIWSLIINELGKNNYLLLLIVVKNCRLIFKEKDGLIITEKFLYFIIRF